MFELERNNYGAFPIIFYTTETCSRKTEKNEQRERERESIMFVVRVLASCQNRIVLFSRVFDSRQKEKNGDVSREEDEEEAGEFSLEHFKDTSRRRTRRERRKSEFIASAHFPSDHLRGRARERKKRSRRDATGREFYGSVKSVGTGCDVVCA